MDKNQPLKKKLQRTKKVPKNEKKFDKSKIGQNQKKGWNKANMKNSKKGRMLIDKKKRAQFASFQQKLPIYAKKEEILKSVKFIINT